MVAISNAMCTDPLSNTAYSALESYFTHLKQAGYMKNDNVFRLIVLLYIRKILSGEYNFEFEEKDYKLMSDTLECLYGTCLIPYEEYLRKLPFVGGMEFKGLLRKSEDEIIRDTEDESYRIIEPGTKIIW